MKLLSFLALAMVSSLGFGNDRYVAPPTASTTQHVPIISDAEMEKCVKLYNEAEWLSKKIDQTVVNSYSQKSVDDYNKMIEEYTNMTNDFNRRCAGKQSRSACEAARKLNKEKGLEHQSCR